MDRINARYNIYSSIHRALRAFMAGVMVQVGRADWQDAQDSEDALAALRQLLEACEAHLAHEDEFVHPAMERRAPGSAAATAGDHREHLHAIDTLRTRALALEQARGPVRDELAHALYLALAAFIAENHEHMDAEETRNNGVLWASYSDAEIQTIESALVASIPPEQMMGILRWMLPSIGHRERVAMLTGLRAEAPAPVYTAVLEMLRPLLGARDTARLDQALDTALPQAA